MDQIKLYEVFLQKNQEVKSVFVISPNNPNDAMALAQLSNPGWTHFGYKNLPVLVD